MKNATLYSESARDFALFKTIFRISLNIAILDNK